MNTERQVANKAEQMLQFALRSKTAGFKAHVSTVLYNIMEWILLELEENEHEKYPNKQLTDINTTILI